MKLMMRKWAVLLFLTYCSASQVRFDGCKVYRVTPQTAEQLHVFKDFQKTSYGYNFWTDITNVGRSVDVMVPSALNPEFLGFVTTEKLPSKIWIEDVQEMIEKQFPTSKPRSEIFDWTTYPTLDDIEIWMKNLTSRYPNVASLIEGGSSFEGRTISGVRLSFKPGNKIAFFEGGAHAREWIAPATVMYILNEFVTSTDPAVRKVAENWDWHIFPTVNPDGYVYSHTTNRLWRKTRKPFGDCTGVDPNRNWDYHWMDGGASNDSCSETYAGPKPFSEIEIKTLSEYINSIASNLEAYITFHSYSQMLLIPYGHAGHEYAKNFEELYNIGVNATEKLKSCYGTVYKVGNVYDVIYVSSGRSPDWVMGTHDVPYVFSYELRDTGKYGFLLPPEQIIPTARETFVSIISIFEQIISKL